MQLAPLSWYLENARELPWRKTREPYPIWVSEVMLQQTRVETVIDYYRRFLDSFPSVTSLASAKIDRVLKVWEGLGYYRRAHNLHKAAGILMLRGGQFPRSAAEWSELPGIGKYTAAAIASRTMGEAVAVLDGNVKRVIARFDGVEIPINTAAAEKALWARAEELLDRESPGDHNQAMMELGATVCTPRNPDCSRCPLAKGCIALKTERINFIPAKSPRKPLPLRRSIALFIRRTSDDSLLIVRRPDNGFLAGLWEFPQVDVKNNESEAEALERLLLELLGTRQIKAEIACSAHHTYTHFHLEVSGYRANQSPLLEKYLKLRFKIRSSDTAKKPEASLGNLPLDWYSPAKENPHALHGAHQKLLVSLQKHEIL